MLNFPYQRYACLIYTCIIIYTPTHPYIYIEYYILYKYYQARLKLVKFISFKSLVRISGSPSTAVVAAVAVMLSLYNATSLYKILITNYSILSTLWTFSGSSSHQAPVQLPHSFPLWDKRFYIHAYMRNRYDIIIAGEFRINPPGYKSQLIINFRQLLYVNVFALWIHSGAVMVKKWGRCGKLWLRSKLYIQPLLPQAIPLYAGIIVEYYQALWNIHAFWNRAFIYCYFYEFILYRYNMWILLFQIVIYNNLIKNNVVLNTISRYQYLHFYNCV